MSQAKITFKNVTKRITLPKTFSELLHSIIVSFSIISNENSYLHIKYIDDESDQIAMSNDFDYQQALNFISKSNLKTLKLVVDQKFNDENNFEIEPKVEEPKCDISFEDLKPEIKVDDEKTKEKNFEEQVNNLFKGINEINKEKEIKPEKKEKLTLVDKLMEELNKKIDKTADKLKNKVKKFAEKIVKLNTEEKKSVKENNVVHKGYTCDGCDKKDISGTRYKCAVCQDFDYCESCEELYKDTHPHPFIKIRNPDRAPVKIACAIPENILPIITEVKPSENHVFNFFDTVVDVKETKEVKTNVIDTLNEIFETKPKNIEVSTDTVTPMPDQKSNKEIKKTVTKNYFRQYKELTNNYDLSNISSLKIGEALEVAKGDIDQALTLLFDGSLDKKVEEVKEIKKPEKIEDPTSCLKLKYGSQFTFLTHQYKVIVATYSLDGMPKEKIYEALFKVNGNVELALLELFN
jgi:hypothetical protein